MINYAPMHPSRCRPGGNKYSDNSALSTNFVMFLRSDSAATCNVLAGFRDRSKVSDVNSWLNMILLACA